MIAAAAIAGLVVMWAHKTNLVSGQLQRRDQEGVANLMARQRSRGARRGGAHPDPGQSTVELALVLPLFFGLLVLVFQVGLVARAEIMVTHAARAAVREAAVTRDGSKVAAAGTRALPGAHIHVVRRGPVGQPVTVEVTYVSHTDLPLIGPLLPDLTLRARADMEVEK